MFRIEGPAYGQERRPAVSPSSPGKTSPWSALPIASSCGLLRCAAKPVGRSPATVPAVSAIKAAGKRYWDEPLLASLSRREWHALLVATRGQALRYEEQAKRA